MKINTHKLIYISLFVALSVILTRFASFRFFIGPVEGIRIGFGSLPIVFSGLLFGPFAGGIVGGLADFLGFVLDPMKSGVYLPQITLVSVLRGVIPPLVIKMFPKSLKYTTISIAFALIVEGFITSIVLMPLILYSAFGIPILATLLPRVISQAIQISIYTGILLILYGRVKRFMHTFFYMVCLK